MSPELHPRAGRMGRQLGDKQQPHEFSEFSHNASRSVSKQQVLHPHHGTAQEELQHLLRLGSHLALHAVGSALHTPMGRDEQWRIRQLE
jgi:hypothetical protein